MDNHLPDSGAQSCARSKHRPTLDPSPIIGERGWRKVNWQFGQGRLDR